MSLSISNNSVSNSVLPKSEGKPSVSESDAGENPGFWDKFKDALSTEKSESDQKVEGTSVKSKTGSESTEALLEDAATQSKSGEINESDEDSSTLKTTKEDKSADVSEGDESSASVKKMTDEAALASAAKVSSDEKVVSGTATASGDKPGSAQAKGNTEAEQAVSENAELLSRLDESNKALQKPAGAEAAAGVAAASVAAEQVQAAAAKPEPLSSSQGLSGEPSELVTQSPQTSNASMTAAGLAGSQVADGKLTPANEGKPAASIDGENKAQANIAWSKSDAELAAKSEAKAALAGAAIAADKVPQTTANAATQTQLAAQSSVGSQANASQGVVAQGTAVNGQSAQVASHPTGDMAAAAAMMAAGKENTKAAAPMGAQVANANISGVKGSNKTQHPASLGNDSALHTAGALTATQQLRAEQQSAATASVQSPMVLTKENASDQVAERVQMMMSKNLKHVDIRLDPPELGRMQIRMSLNNDSATVHFTVQNQQTRDMVDQAMPRLREMLSQQGIQLADTSVQQQGQQQRHASHGSGSGGSGNGTSNAAGDVDSVENGSSVEVAVKQSNDGISYYA
ncbi:flagellar hook-length control protein FliK [Vibrio sp. 10N]|uniref:flagellar hook-length control protein FliK n=1 Tax=Vibrio sp. 10N TaxID=3058938 RepID=UPI002813C382|nr:flagellar hook-length control protein FliK [Vibrio sp. 10N]